MSNTKKFVAMIVVITLIVCGCSTNDEIHYDNDHEAIIYNNKTYYYIPIPNGRVCHYTGNKYLGKTDVGQRIYNVDRTDDFICTRTWDGEPTLYGMDQEDIFDTTIATGVFINDDYIDDAEAAKAFLSLYYIQGESYEYVRYDKKNISIFICYNDLPIATVWVGSISHVDNVWVYNSPEEIGEFLDKNLSDKNYDIIKGTIIPNEILQDLIQYLK